MGDNLFLKIALIGVAAYVGYRYLDSPQLLSNPAPAPRPSKPEAYPVPVFAIRSVSGFVPYAKVPYRWLSTRVQ